MWAITYHGYIQVPFNVYPVLILGCDPTSPFYIHFTTCICAYVSLLVTCVYLLVILCIIYRSFRGHTYPSSPRFYILPCLILSHIGLLGYVRMFIYVCIHVRMYVRDPRVGMVICSEDIIRHTRRFDLWGFSPRYTHRCRIPSRFHRPGRGSLELQQ